MRALLTVVCVAAGLVLIGGSAGAGAVARPAAGASTLPPPHFGHSFDIGLVSGTVIVTPRGGHAFILGPQDRNIPIGSRIDTTHGRVDLRTAPPPPGTGATPATASARVEDAQFYGGAFTVRQSSALPVAEIRLAGGQFGPCSAPSRDRPAVAGGGPGRLAHAVVRLLHASGSGKFETRGRYSAATVLGTRWTTVDYCDGTLVQVGQGVVSVEDLVTHATVIVHAGHSFFAEAPAG
jgi:hypothetical protein